MARLQKIATATDSISFQKYEESLRWMDNRPQPIHWQEKSEWDTERMDERICCAKDLRPAYNADNIRKPVNTPVQTERLPNLLVKSLEVDCYLSSDGTMGSRLNACRSCVPGG